MKKRTRIAVVILALLCVTFGVIAFANLPPERPDTDLEFWICDNVDDFDFSGYQPLFGLMGGREYYGTGYSPGTDENGQQTDPKHCVIYTVTAYPDYSSGQSHITGITVTDPAVAIWGLTTESSHVEIEAVMQNNGYKRQTTGGITYRKGKVTVRFTEGVITIRAEVTNRLGLLF